MNMADDYYNTLGVSRDASQEDIKKAYRKLAHKHHPDKDGGDEEAFKKVSEAYSILGNKEKKAQYDQFGQTFEGGGPSEPFGSGGSSPFGVNINMEDIGGFSDIFDSFFGGRRRGKQTRKGSDVGIDITISFKESARGVKKEISHRIYQPCSHCNGNGAEPGTPIKDCSACDGQGVVTRTRQTPLGAFSQRTTCPDCEGEGKKPEQPCSVCNGQAREMRDRKLEIDIPAGIADGQTIRIGNKGETPPRGGISGDLYATIRVEKDETMQRDGDNIRSNITISFTDAALGAKKTINTLDGSRELGIPAGTQPGTEFRFEREGFQQLQGVGIGDHIITVQVEVPRRLSRKQKQLLKEFQSNKKKGLF